MRLARKGIVDSTTATLRDEMCALARSAWQFGRAASKGSRHSRCRLNTVSVAACEPASHERRCVYRGRL